MFVFQACYRTPQVLELTSLSRDWWNQKNGQTIQGIRVSVANNPQYLYTNEDGSFSLYTEFAESYKVISRILTQIQNGLSIAKIPLCNIGEKIYWILLGRNRCIIYSVKISTFWLETRNQDSCYEIICSGNVTSRVTKFLHCGSIAQQKDLVKDMPWQIFYQPLTHWIRTDDFYSCITGEATFTTGYWNMRQRDKKKGMSGAWF